MLNLLLSLQMEAVKALERFATPATRLALTDLIENEQCFYKVRCAAAFCLAKVIPKINTVSTVFPPFSIFLGSERYGCQLGWSSGDAHDIPQTVWLFLVPEYRSSK
jgi:hypothetical protein